MLLVGGTSGSRCSPARPRPRRGIQQDQRRRNIYLLLMRPKPPAGRPTQPSHLSIAPSALVGGTYSACVRRAAGPSHPAPPDSPVQQPRQSGRSHLPDPDSREGGRASQLLAAGCLPGPRGHLCGGAHLYQCRPSVYLQAAAAAAEEGRRRDDS